MQFFFDIPTIATTVGMRHPFITISESTASIKKCRTINGMEDDIITNVNVYNIYGLSVNPTCDVVMLG